MDLLFIVLRLLHIFTGVFWAGTAFFLVSFLSPAVNKAGPAGGQVMGNLARSSYPKVLPILIVTNVATGLIMYFLDSGGLQWAWIITGTGLAFTFAGIAAIIAMIIGLAIALPATKNIAALGAQIAQSSKPPTAEQQAQMKKFQDALTASAYRIAILLALTLIGMASARYLRF